jgi:hypothetical protein
VQKCVKCVKSTNPSKNTEEASNQPKTQKRTKTPQKQKAYKEYIINTKA